MTDIIFEIEALNHNYVRKFSRRGDYIIIPEHIYYALGQQIESEIMPIKGTKISKFKKGISTIVGLEIVVVKGILEMTIGVRPQNVL